MTRESIDKPLAAAAVCNNSYSQVTLEVSGWGSSPVAAACVPILKAEALCNSDMC